MEVENPVLQLQSCCLLILKLHKTYQECHSPWLFPKCHLILVMYEHCNCNQISIKTLLHKALFDHTLCLLSKAQLWNLKFFFLTWLKATFIKYWISYLYFNISFEKQGYREREDTGRKIIFYQLFHLPNDYISQTKAKPGASGFIWVSQVDLGPNHLSFFAGFAGIVTSSYMRNATVTGINVCLEWQCYRWRFNIMW